MVKIILNLLFTAAAFYSAFFLTRPEIKEMSFKNRQLASLKENFENIEKVKSLRDGLLERFNEISGENIDKLSKIAPATVNEGEIMLMLDGLAKSSGLMLTNISFSKEDENKPFAAARKEKITPYYFSLDLTGTYAGFKNFLKSFEKSVLIMDTESISFESVGKDLKVQKSGEDFYKFKLKAAMYIRNN